MGPNIGTVGVVGAGTMGAGIAQVALEAGHQVRLHDQSLAALEAAAGRINVGLKRRATTTGRGIDWIAGCQDRLGFAFALEELASTADLVIEAALEELDSKQAIFRTLAEHAPPHSILATNTSALSVTAISAATTCPERVLGLHFFNPAPVMRLVEVVATPTADPAALDRATGLMTAWGKTPVRCADSPGFIVNRVNRPFTIEALRMLEAGEAGCHSIDVAMREAGFPMGPFELMDLVGIDVNLATARGVWVGLGRPERLRPSEIQEELVAGGHLGRKSGRGFYLYDDAGRAIGPAHVPVHPAPGQAARLTATTIAERIRDAIDAEARLTVAAGLTTPSDIELALELGAGHPPRTGPRTIAT